MFKEVFDQKFSASQHMILCMDEVINYVMGMDYTPNHRELTLFACKIMNEVISNMLLI